MKTLIFLKYLVCIYSFTPHCYTTCITRNTYTPISTHISLQFSNNTEIDHNPDFIEKYSNWFGLFPPEKKWKSVRFTFYSVISGYLFAEALNNMKLYIELSKFNI